MGYATTMMKKTGRAMRLDTQIIEVRPLLLRKEQVRLRLRETCARNHKNKKPKSLDTADVVRDVEISVLTSLRCAVKGASPQRVKVPPGNWFAPPGSNQSGDRGNEVVGASGVEGRVGDLASMQAVT